MAARRQRARRSALDSSSPGETVDLPDGLGTVTFDGVKRFASLDIHHDPSQVWVLLFAVLIARRAADQPVRAAPPGVGQGRPTDDGRPARVRGPRPRRRPDPRRAVADIARTHRRSGVPATSPAKPATTRLRRTIRLPSASDGRKMLVTADLAAYSLVAVYSAIAIYAIAFIAFVLDLAKRSADAQLAAAPRRSRRRPPSMRPAPGPPRPARAASATVSGSAAGGSTIVLERTAATASVDVEQPRRASKFERVGISLMVLGLVVHVASVVLARSRRRARAVGEHVRVRR